MKFELSPKQIDKTERVTTEGYKTAELLDIYEARVLFGKQWNFDYRGGTDRRSLQLSSIEPTKIPINSQRKLSGWMCAPNENLLSHF
jgi:hypothetical protein